jgi:hypothetical protein
MWPQALIMVSGAVLILCGVIAIMSQLIAETNYGQPRESAGTIRQQQQSITVSPGSLQASTRFVGIELVLIGALLEIVGYVSTVPWRNPPQSN